MIDAHISLKEPYSYENLMKYATSALHKGIEELIVLEPTHKFIECAPLYREIRATYPCQEEWYDNIQKISIVEYQTFIEQMRTKEFPVKIRFGLCVCYFTQHEFFIRQLLKAFPYDICVGSIQFLDNIAFYWKEHSYEMLWNKYNADFLYRRYYEMMNALLTSHIFHGVSGFDNIKILGIKPHFNMKHTYHKMAMLMAEHHIYVEDDTSVHYRYGHPDHGLNEEFLSVCEELGVEIKAASNAHTWQEVAKEFKEI